MNTTTTESTDLTPFDERIAELVAYPSQAEQAKTEMHDLLNAWLHYAQETDDAELHGAVVMLLSRCSQLADYVHNQAAMIGTILQATHRLKKQREHGSG